MSLTSRALVRRLIPALCAAALLADPSGAAAQGVAGPYLAAEQAARRGDLQAAAAQYAEALARDPQNTMLLERALMHRLAAGSVGPAVALARRMDAVGGGRAGEHLAAITLAADALMRGEPGKAGGVLEGEVDAENGFVGALMRPWAVFATGETELALEMMREVEDGGIAGPAGRYLAAFHGGLMLAAIGDDAGAVAAFERAREGAGAGTRRLVRAQAVSLARLGRVEEAVEVLETWLTRSYSDPQITRLRREIAEGAQPEPIVADAAQGAAEALYGLSRYLVRGPNRLVGLGYVRLAAHLRPDFIDAHLLLAEQMVQAEQYELAVRSYDAIPEDAAEALDARIGRAAALEGEEKVDEAVQALRAAIARWPREIDAHRALADLLRRHSRFEEAAEAYDGAIALIDTPENRHWPLFYQRGITLERSKQWARAEEDFRKALELEPDQPLVLNYLGYSWVEMGRNLDEAQAMIEKAVEQRPEDGYIVDSLGWVLYRLGKFEQAVEHLGRAVELRPVDPVINDHYGDALWMVGRRVEAEFQWNRALSFDPEEEVVERIDRKLEFGLDTVLAEEAAAGRPAIIGQTGETATDNDGG
ncbi:tetratricopeptide repeat protein [Paralimibaculum aggregatum]|uniref:Tetratricopeptide repeat protein n=1 Tax=Paralimibaculum aggregatum TaxID=3036245 RepID=A0ABQ6LN70_9RHOB|nr:tetratricopeptide repeat protein [Limibaculum sp. NKW23]GMG82079.1 tetratricopeptide repeat protein [Limibaculum sp. NKW23]